MNDSINQEFLQDNFESIQKPQNEFSLIGNQNFMNILNILKNDNFKAQ